MAGLSIPGLTLVAITIVLMLHLCRCQEDLKVCTPANCSLPDCFCAGSTIPGGLPPENTPQMVLFTFNDPVNKDVYGPLMDLFGMDKNRTNPNGCPIGMTLFVTNNLTDYCMVAEFYRNGHEVASRTITHKFPITFWAQASYEEYDHEIDGQRAMLTKLAGIPKEEITGFRSPFIQPGGDVQFTVLKDRNFTYDSSLLVVMNATHRLWPYTLDTPNQTACGIAPCPSKGYPGLWELPIQPIPDHTDTLCSFLDQCQESNTNDEVYGYLMRSFNASYHNSRAPLILNMQAYSFNKNHHSLEGFRRFIDELVAMKDTYIITATQLIEWMRKPTSLTQLPNSELWKCNDKRTTTGCSGSDTPCDPATCSLPDCFCAGTTIPGGLPPEKTPQMVLFTFDDAVNKNVYGPLMDLFGMDKNRNNPNGCPIGMTLFVSNNLTDYCVVAEFYRNGHEVASHSITHKFPVTFWAQASYEEYAHEIDGQRAMLTKLAGIPKEQITGFRSPFLQTGGDVQFRVLKDRNFTYDSSLLVVTYRVDRLWPYTLDPPSQTPCGIPPCPTKGYPGLWELPIQSIREHTGTVCTFLDRCQDLNTADEVYSYLMQSFYTSYHHNRVPLILNTHANWFNANDQSLEGFRRFIDKLIAMKDTYIITATQLIEWMRKPTSLTQLPNSELWKCNKKRTTTRCSESLLSAGQNRTGGLLPENTPEMGASVPATCSLPDCFSAGTTIPGGLTRENTPQMVLFTFNDPVNNDLYAPLMNLFGMDKNMTNPNGCPIGMTLFVPHNLTNYCMVAEFYRNGHEVASHSITKRLPIPFWAQASYEEYDHEIDGQRAMLTKLAGIPKEEITGFRSPFIQPGGDVQFRVLKDRNFTYDSSLLVVTKMANRLWPYTLDQPSQTPCSIAPCPSKGYPGLWELPIQPIPDHTGTLCSFLDRCQESNTADEVYGYLMQSFNASYHNNRVPLILNMHANWFNDNDHSLEGFRRFIDELVVMNDTYIITATQLIEWMRKPSSLTQLPNSDLWKCNNKRTTTGCSESMLSAGQNRTKKPGIETYMAFFAICFVYLVFEEYV